VALLYNQSGIDSRHPAGKEVKKAEIRCAAVLAV
jgi:hypothetical protein